MKIKISWFASSNDNTTNTFKPIFEMVKASGCILHDYKVKEKVAGSQYEYSHYIIAEGDVENLRVLDFGMSVWLYRDTDGKTTLDDFEAIKGRIYSDRGEKLNKMLGD